MRGTTNNCGILSLSTFESLSDVDVGGIAVCSRRQSA